MNTYELIIKYSHYHPAYGHSYSTGVLLNGKYSGQLHSRFDNLFLSLDKVLDVIRDFSTNRPVWLDCHTHERTFSTRYLIRWDFASIDKLKFFPKVG